MNTFTEVMSYVITFIIIISVGASAFYIAFMKKEKPEVTEETFQTPDLFHGIEDDSILN